MQSGGTWPDTRSQSRAFVGGLDERDVPLHTSRRVAAFLSFPHAAEPPGVAPVNRANVDVVTLAHEPHDDRLAQCASDRERCDSYFLGAANCHEFVTRTCGDWCVSSRCAHCGARTSATSPYQ